MSIRTFCLLVAGLFASAGAAAQSLPKPDEFYFDADPTTTRPIVAVKETGDAAIQKLLKAIERNPRAKEEHAQLAHLAMEGGRADLGKDLYARALARVTSSDALWRPLVWNYGWDLLRSGDADGALAQWQQVVTLRRSNASWIPPTLALALWSAGRKDEALQWYAAAVRTEPQQWRDPANFPRLLPEWRESERATLAEVEAAWAANPPAWP
ncbi:tetratricopeptide repeat protein [Lysobacter yangpyeongensis]|uniref:Tetratricopeptide repeat protein n=1 Tax=Lysobacter yangpyeongensis TaxID=346182 RepID=A0ABW0SQP1_9GAMM